ncbi:CHRD domain-containing protein [Rhodospirillaceae bacterium SYSU D60014]|uniref:CHRD domain-containing protein n=1 Tax=Virgifigura deserti TaxID=2268457 RepID=UPI000E675475
MLILHYAGRVFGLIAIAATFWAWGSVPGQAALITLETTLDGFQEVDPEGNPAQGDLDGFGTAVLVIDDADLTIDWDLTFGNIVLPLIGAHIHQAPAGVVGPIVVDFMAQPSGSNLSDPDLANVLANPTGFYVNLHNDPFPAGAIRGQLPQPPQVIPEPAAVGLLGVAMVALAMLGRRVRRVTSA